MVRIVLRATKRTPVLRRQGFPSCLFEPLIALLGPLVSWLLLLQGFTLGYEAVDSLIVIDTPDAVKAFTTTSFSIDADVGMGVGKLAGQVTPFSYSAPASCSPLHRLVDALEMLPCHVLECVHCRR